MIKLIVGLGNPGSQYEKTRHNAGFLFVDHLAECHGVRWAACSQFSGDVASVCCAKGKVELLKPMTFMNKSGMSVGKFLKYYRIKPEEMLVVHDEIELAEGGLRLKFDGGHAGHNGLRDIIADIGTRGFFRLRVGVGRPVGDEVSVADYVLSKVSLQTILRLSLLFGLVEKHLDLVLDGDIGAVNAAFIE